MLDTARHVSTPEGIELTLKLAGPVPRAIAWAFDTFTRAIVFWIVAMIAATAGWFGQGVALLFWFFLEWLYPATCEVLFNGATPGKKLMRLRVLHDDGTPVRWGAALNRNLLRAVDFLPFLYGFGLASMLLHRDFKRLGDIVAGTVVVYDDAMRATARVADVRPCPPPVSLTPAERRAVVDYAARTPVLTEARAEELAEAATPLVGGLSGSLARDRLLGIAAHLAGRR